MATVSINNRGIETRRGHAVVNTTNHPHSTHPAPGLDHATGAGARGGGFTSVSPRTAGGVYDFVDRRLQAEWDQARCFDDMLRAEISQLEQAIRSIEIRNMRRAAGRIDQRTPPAELLKLRSRIGELHRQRAALWRRFLGPSQSDDLGNALNA